MKRVLKRSTMILAFTLAFIGGIGFFAFEFIFKAEDWVDQPYNAHISGNGGLEQAGAILDRNGVPLAQTIDGRRAYNDDHSVRTGLLHTVGDNSLNISTAVQSKYRSLLTGYSRVWGLNMPASLRTSHDVTLTVDASACAQTYDALSATGERGACVVYNYRTGEVIASVSTYSYDPEAPPEINEENESEYEGVYLDNVVSSTYTPGSIFKIVTAAAAIENIPDLFERRWYCEGGEEIGGHMITCSDDTAHGELDFYGAMAQSCNVVFGELAAEIGAEKMTETAEKIGINAKFSFDDISTPRGTYNVSKADTHQLALSGIGQYSDRVNPMQMAIICGAIANGGTSVNPTYIKSGSGDILKQIGLKGGETREMFKPDTAAKLTEVLRYTVQNSYGDSMFGGLTVCAKTGTAEVGEDKLPNSWMVGYALDSDAPLAFACVVENGGYGISTAGPIVSTALSASAKAVRGY